MSAVATVVIASACAGAPPVERRTVVRMTPGTTIIAATVEVRCPCGSGPGDYVHRSEVPLPQAPGSEASLQLGRRCDGVHSSLSLGLLVLEGGRLRLSQGQESVAEGLLGTAVTGSSKGCTFQLGSSTVQVK